MSSRAQRLKGRRASQDVARNGCNKPAESERESKKQKSQLKNKLKVLETRLRSASIIFPIVKQRRVVRALKRMSRALRVIINAAAVEKESESNRRIVMENDGTGCNPLIEQSRDPDPLCHLCTWLAAICV